MVGVFFGKVMVLSFDIFLIEVYYMKVYVMVYFVEILYLDFFFFCLIVFGGYIQIVKIISYLDMVIFGQIIDDVVGEVFDKIGKILGLEYLVGLIIDCLV